MSHFPGVDLKYHFEGHDCLKPGINDSESEAHHRSRHMDAKDTRLLEVGDDRQTESRDASDPQTDPVDGHDATAIV